MPRRVPWTGRKRGTKDLRPALKDADLFNDKTDIAFEANDQCIGVLVDDEENEKTFQLSYGIPTPIFQKLRSFSYGRSIFWSHTWYRNNTGDPLKVTYVSNLKDSEELAKSFLKEKVVGFDMEWRFSFGKRYSGIKNNISLIQVASETEIGLFHIALHSGYSVKHLVAPSLRKLIETDTVTKVGVAIHSADGRRLQQFMKLKPKGLFELSHLYRLVKYSETAPRECNRKIVGLSAQVHEHLGFPLFKGPVRTSDWSQPLNEEQIRYAANDAYAGLMLFHVMETKRLKLNPVPPRPFYVDLGLPIRLAKSGVEETSEGGAGSIDEQPDTYVSRSQVQSCTSKRGSEPENLTTSTAEERLILGVSNQSLQNSQNSMKRNHTKDGNDTPPKRPRASQSSKYKGWSDLAPDDQVLFEALYENRTAIVEREKANGKKVSAFIVAYNTTLVNLARLRPTDTASLLQVPLIGNRKAELYGTEWLSIISRHSKDKRSPLSHELESNSAMQNATEDVDRVRKLLPPPVTSIHSPIVISSSPAFEDRLESSPMTCGITRSPAKDSTPIRNTQVKYPPSATIFVPQTQTLPSNSHVEDPSQRRLLSALTALRLRLSHLASKGLHNVCLDTTLSLIATRQPTSRADICRIPGAGKFMMLAKNHNIDLLSFLEKQASMAATQQSQLSAPLSSLPNFTQANRTLEATASVNEAQQKLIMLDWVDSGIASAIGGMVVQSSKPSG